MFAQTGRHGHGGGRFRLRVTDLSVSTSFQTEEGGLKAFWPQPPPLPRKKHGCNPAQSVRDYHGKAGILACRQTAARHGSARPPWISHSANSQLRDSAGLPRMRAPASPFQPGLRRRVTLPGYSGHTIHPPGAHAQVAAPTCHETPYRVNSRNWRTSRRGVDRNRSAPAEGEATSCLPQPLAFPEATHRPYRPVLLPYLSPAEESRPQPRRPPQSARLRVSGTLSQTVCSSDRPA